MESHPARFRSISIHALREEGDAIAALPWLDTINFYPRPPRGGRRYEQLQALENGCISIHALREEGDARENGEFEGWNYFYPRPPRGGRLPFLLRDVVCRFISIHALREEGDATFPA